MAGLSHQIANRQTLGFFSFRHHDPDLPPARRSLLAGGRVVYEQETGITQVADVGDVQSYMYWPEATEGDRQPGEGGERGSWSASFSAVVSQAPAAASAPPAAQGLVPQLHSYQGGPNLMLPVRAEWEPATRYRQLGIGRPSHGSEILPRGLSGIVTAAMDEDEQRSMFHADFVGLFAPSRWGDARAGTILYDLGADGEIDDTRASRLQQILETVDLGPERVPSLVLSYSRMGGQRGGLHVVDHRWGMVGVGDGDPAVAETVPGTPANQVGGGPFVVGSPDTCRHSFTAPLDADGRPVVPLHVSTRTNYLGLPLAGFPLDGPMPFFEDLTTEDLGALPFFSLDLSPDGLGITSENLLKAGGASTLLTQLRNDIYRESLILYSDTFEGWRIVSRDTFTTISFSGSSGSAGGTRTRQRIPGNPIGSSSGRPRAPGGTQRNRNNPNSRNPNNPNAPWDPGARGGAGAGGGRRRPQRPPAAGGGAPDPYKRGRDPTEDDRRWLYEQPFSPFNPNFPYKEIRNPTPANTGSGAAGGRAAGAVLGGAGGAAAAAGAGGILAGGAALPGGRSNEQEGDDPGEYAFSPFCVAAPNFTWVSVPTAPNATAIGNGVGLNGQSLEDVRSQIRPAATFDAYAAGDQLELDSVRGADGAFHAATPILSLRPTAVRRADVLAGDYDLAGTAKASPVAPVRYQVPGAFGSIDLAYPVLGNASGSGKGARIRQASNGDGIVIVALDTNGEEVGDELSLTSSGLTLGGSPLSSGGGASEFGGSGADGATTTASNTQFSSPLNATSWTLNSGVSAYAPAGKPLVTLATGAMTINGTIEMGGRGIVYEETGGAGGQGGTNTSGGAGDAPEAHSSGGPEFGRTLLAVTLGGQGGGGGSAGGFEAVNSGGTGADGKTTAYRNAAVMGDAGDAQSAGAGGAASTVAGVAGQAGDSASALTLGTTWEDFFAALGGQIAGLMGGGAQGGGGGGGGNTGIDDGTGFVYGTAGTVPTATLASGATPGSGTDGPATGDGLGGIGGAAGPGGGVWRGEAAGSLTFGGSSSVNLGGSDGGDGGDGGSCDQGGGATSCGAGGAGGAGGSGGGVGLVRHTGAKSGSPTSDVGGGTGGAAGSGATTSGAGQYNGAAGGAGGNGEDGHLIFLRVA